MPDQSGRATMGRSVSHLTGFLVQCRSRRTGKYRWAQRCESGGLTELSDQVAAAQGQVWEGRVAQAHRRYFARQANREGFEIDDEILTVLQRFEVVWPLDIAMRSRDRLRQPN